MVKFKEEWKIVSWVFDKSTLENLKALKNQGYDLELISPISMGKEASVFLAKLYDDYVAVKIYALESSIFKKRIPYIFDDPRIPRISKKIRVLIKYWVKKEYLNLLKAWELGINVPRPITYRFNILVMDFIGEKRIPSPKLKQVEEINEYWLEKILNWVRIYWNEGYLVHGDLSEYNVLIYKNNPYLIDFSLGVMKFHPLANYLLKRDIEKIVNFFSKKLKKNYNIKEIYKKVKKNEEIKI